MATQLEDFGEKIGGARKDLWVERMLSFSVQADDIVKQPLGKIWPIPNWQKLINDGHDAWKIAIIRAYRENIPLKPRAGSRRFGYEINLYSHAVSSGIEMSAQLLRDTQTKEEITAKLSDRIAIKSALYEKLGHDTDLSDVASEHMFSNDGGFYVIGLKDYFKGDHPHPLAKLVEKRGFRLQQIARSPVDGLTATADLSQANLVARNKLVDLFCDKFKAWQETQNEQAHDGQQPKEKSVSKRLNAFCIVRAFGEDGYFLAPKTSRYSKSAYLAGKFAGSAQASKWARENLEELERRHQSVQQTAKIQQVIDVTRNGPNWRNPAIPVTPELFQKTFGFRGVEFGNWVNQKERQDALNRAYDAFLDMAYVMGMRAQDISLGGTLAISFGSRGVGGHKGAAAAYFLDRQVMNLTKTHGAGSLAHEWFHGLDHLHTRQAGHPRTFSSNVADTKRQDVLPAPLYQAFLALNKAMTVDYDHRSSYLDAIEGKRDGYYALEEEKAARAFEAVVQERLAQQGLHNGFLVAIPDEESWNITQALHTGGWLHELNGNEINQPESYPYPKSSELLACDQAFERIVQSSFYDGENVRELDFAPWTPSEADHGALFEQASDNFNEFEADDSDDVYIEPAPDYSRARQGSLF